VRLEVFGQLDDPVTLVGIESTTFYITSFEAIGRDIEEG
jgi:hypothetical protein